MRIQRPLLILLFFVNLTFLSAQCTDTYLKVLGTKSSSERGYAVVASPTERSVYVSATREDSLIIIKLDSLGQLIWSRRLEIESGRAESINGVVLDADGMLGIVGTVGTIDQQGNCFVARYDPNANILLWSQRMLSTSMGFASGILEVGDNYVVFNNPTSPNDAEVVMVSIADGAINSNFSKHYHVGSAETIGDMVLYNGALYGTGRFTQGAANTSMRNAVFSMNPANGNLLWTRLGHKSEFDDARIYGADIVVANNSIYALSLGDENGGSIDATEIFVQKLDLDGNVDWVKQYELPGGNDWGDEIIEVPGGLVVMGRNRITPSDVILFQIDLDGNVQWAKRYDHDVNDNSVTLGGITSQLVLLEDHLYFTAFADNTDADILLIRTDLQGNVSGDCDNVASLNIPVRTIDNPVFYAIEPEVTEFIPERVGLPVNVGVGIHMNEQLVCGIPAAIHTEVHAEICEGESYEGYSVSGSFQDTFATARGCDSVRTLHLLVEICQPDCGTTSSSVYGEPNVEERASCIVASRFSEAVYVAATREDNSVLIKMNYNGDILWSREFDIIAQGDEVPGGIVEDSDGMIVVVGTGIDVEDGGPLFGFRYDPKNNVVLWAQQYAVTPREINFGLIEKGPGGNYLLNNVDVYTGLGHMYAGVFEIDRATGEPNLTFAKNYQIIGTETLYELAWFNGALYGVGRYKDGGVNEKMRNTITRLDPTNGDQMWVKMGHRAAEQNARLYGSDLVIHDNSIFSIYHGDPNGVSLTNTKTYVQRTSLNGDLIWLQQYELPGNADFCVDIAVSDGGLIVLNREDFTDILYMFKIDLNGNLLWAKSIPFDNLISASTFDRASSQLVEAGDQLFFIGFGYNTNGDQDLVVVRTDLEGNLNDPCIQSLPADIVVNSVDDITWYNKQVIEHEREPQAMSRQATPVDIVIPLSEDCAQADTLFSELAITICQGQSFETYSEAGVYQDTFVTAEGCDSIRILTLTVTPPVKAVVDSEICTGESYLGFTQTGIYADTFSLPSGCDSIRVLRLTVFTCEPIIAYDLDACRSYMSDGSIMDYSEFDPEYPNALDCGEVEATILFRSPPTEHKHSCTEGMNGTLAMCVSAISGCTYLPGDAASVVVEFTVDPDPDSIVAFNKIEFFEKAPSIYSWIDGPSGPNNYPQRYGIRILKNGTEIFEQHDIATSQNWTLQSYNFNDLPAFKVNATTTFRIELLPYCPVNNGSLVSAWDLENVRLFASCDPDITEGLIIEGTVATWNATPVRTVTLQLATDALFNNPTTEVTPFNGTYVFEGVQKYQGYYLTAGKDIQHLQGVNTLDLIALQKHLLGKQSFTTLDQLIAADINRTQSVNVMDLIELRKVLLGITTTFPNNTSWRFGAQPVNLNSKNINEFNEEVFLEAIFAPVTAMDWLGVKVGDVNRDIRQNIGDGDIEIRTVTEYPVYTEILQTQADGYIQLAFKADETVRLEGLQASLDLHGMILADVEMDKLPLGNEFYHVDDAGHLRISWNDIDPVSIARGDVLFTLRLKGYHGQSISLATDVLQAEVYTTADTRSIQLNAKGAVESGMIEDLEFEVVPNPFKGSCAVHFYMPADGKVTIQVFTPVGELIYEAEKSYAAGDQVETISLDPYKGIPTMLFCQFTHEGRVTSKRVFKLE